MPITSSRSASRFPSRLSLSGRIRPFQRPAMRMFAGMLLGVVALVLPMTAQAGGASPEISQILFSLFCLVSSAQILGWLAARLGQPRVIGQVLAGVLVGPSLLGLVEVSVTLQALAEFGAIFLMFMVGLETRLKDLMAVGKEALLVALLGIALPMLGG